MGYTVEGLKLEESGKPGGLAARWEPLIARLFFPDLLEFQKTGRVIHLLKREGIGWAEGCDRASAKDFHEIRAVFTRGVA